MKHAWLFDVDGVLCEPQQQMGCDFAYKLVDLTKAGHEIFLVTGNAFEKAVWQTGITQQIFCDNANELRYGWMAEWEDKNSPPLAKEIDAFLCGAMMGRLMHEKPVFGNHIVWRTPNFINFSFVGRNCPQHVRDTYESNGELEELAAKIMQAYPEVEAVRGGQISIDIYTKGADKSRAGKWLNDNGYTFTFIGDKTAPGGNDYPLAEYCRLHPENKCFTVAGPDDTLRLLKDLTT